MRYLTNPSDRRNEEIIMVNNENKKSDGSIYALTIPFDKRNEVIIKVNN